MMTNVPFSDRTPTVQHAGASAVICALRIIARGRAVYVSRLAAMVCWAARLAPPWNSSPYGLLLCQYRGFLA